MFKRIALIGTFTLATIVLISGTALAGVMEAIKAIVGAEAIWVGVVTVVLLYVMKRIPNDKIQLIVGNFAYGVGVAMTLGLSKFPYTAPFWNKHIEPIFIDLLNNTVGTFVSRFIAGLQSNNKDNV